MMITETTTETTTPTPAGVIAIDPDLTSGAIYGIGYGEGAPAAFAARADARRGAGPDADFGYVPATDRLLAAVERDGGGDGDVCWELTRGHADHIGTDPADVTAYALADLADENAFEVTP